MLLIVGGFFAYARDRRVRGTPQRPGCSLEEVLNSSLSLQEKRAFFDAELSFGTVAQVAEGAPPLLTITQSTLPFREGQALGKADLCRAGGREVTTGRPAPNSGLLSLEAASDDGLRRALRRMCL